MPVLSVIATEVTASEPSVSAPPAPEWANPAPLETSDRLRSMVCVPTCSATAGAAPWLASANWSSTASTTRVIGAEVVPLVALGSVLSSTLAVMVTPERSTSLSSGGVSSRS